jgi:hypothetical protein
LRAIEVVPAAGLLERGARRRDKHLLFSSLTAIDVVVKDALVASVCGAEGFVYPVEWKVIWVLMIGHILVGAPLLNGEGDHHSDQQGG